MDTSETLAGKRERAPVEGVMDSDIPTQSVDKKCRAGDLHFASVADKEMVKKHAQWRHADMMGNIDAQTHKHPGAPFNKGGGGPVLFAWAAEECNRISGQELAEGQEPMHADLARKAKERKLDAWRQFEIFSPVVMQSRDVVGARWVLTWKQVKARLVAKGYQDPGIRNGNVDIAGYVSRRSSRLQSLSLGALKRRAIWSLDVKNALLRADGFDRAVYVRAPCKWISKDDRRIRRLRAPAYGLNDAPVAFRRPSHKYLATSV